MTNADKIAQLRERQMAESHAPLVLAAGLDAMSMSPMCLFSISGDIENDPEVQRLLPKYTTHPSEVYKAIVDIDYLSLVKEMPPAERKALAQRIMQKNGLVR